MVDLGDIDSIVLGGGGGGDSDDDDSIWNGSDDGSVSEEKEEADSEPIFSPSLTEPLVFTKACSLEPSKLLGC
jgi:hypothetical protein